MKRLIVLLCFVVSPALAQQSTISNYDSARDTHFYNTLYSGGGLTLYCQSPFQNRSGLNVEHVLPASWMKEAAGCEGQSRKQCRTSSQAFNFMEADLHNLYPALAHVNRARSNFEFAIIGLDVNEPDFGACDFEVDKDADLAEPRPGARGEIARAIFYMVHAYGIEIGASQLELMKTWNRADEVSAEEVRRNNVIEGIQGNRNPYIDDPSLANVVSTGGANDDQWEDCLIKGNINSSGDKIYHVPGSASYSRTKIDKSKGERWFCTTAEAEAAGWRAPL